MKNIPTICFDLMFKGERCGSSWARCSVLNDGGKSIECRQVTFDNPSIGLSKSRRQSSYVFNATDKLISADLKDHNGNHVHIDQDTSINFILEQNMMALSAMLLEGLKIQHHETLSALVPETGATIPYEVNCLGQTLQTSLKEAFSIGSDGRISTIQPSACDFVFERCQRRFPRWSLDNNPKPMHYRPPDTIRVQDTTLKISPDGTAHREATFVQPKTLGDMIASGVFIGGTGVYNRHGFTASFDIGYHQLLDDLAGEGIASLRYEKFDPTAISLEEAEGDLGFKELCTHATNALSWLSNKTSSKSQPKIAIGHSLGGLVALKLSAQQNDLDAIVLLSTPGRPLREILQEQQGWFLKESEMSKGAAKESSALSQVFIKALEDDAEWTLETVDARILAFKRKRKLYSTVLNLDPCKLVAQGQCPVIIVQGTTDVQVASEDANKLAKACEEAGRPYHLLLEDGLDHLLKRNTETGLKALRIYKDRRRRIPITLIRKIAKAVKELIPA